jgi:hypothetical protein
MAMNGVVWFLIGVSLALSAAALYVAVQGRAVPAGNQGDAGTPNNPGDAGRDAGTPNPSESECFVKGTLVVTDKGSVPIEDVKLGDSIYSFAIDKPNDASIRDVRGISSRICKSIFVIGFGTGEIRCTGRQAFLCEGKWLRASQLTPGQKILNRAGRADAITQVRRQANDVPVFHLSVEGTGAYFVKRTRIVNGVTPMLDDDDDPGTQTHKN